MADQEDKELAEKFQQRFAELPKVVQDAITSADIEQQLRKLADTNKLHLDQWVALENEVMLALYGFQPAEDLQKNIKSEINISDETALALATDISRIVFEPIRQELERELEHPDAKAREMSDIEAAREQVLAEKPVASSQQLESKPVAGSQQPVANSEQATSSVIPATPPPTPPTEKAVRAPLSSVYKPGEASTERKNVHDDPYREPPA